MLQQSYTNDWTATDGEDTSQTPFICQSLEQIERERAGRPLVHTRLPHYAIVWVRGGKGVYHIDFKSYQTLHDTLFFVSPEQVQQLVIEHPQGYVILLSPEFMEAIGITAAFLNTLGLFSSYEERPPLLLSPDDTPMFSLQMQHLQQEYERPQTPFRYESIGAWLRILLIEAYRLQVSAQPQPRNILPMQIATVRIFKKQVESFYKKYHRVAEYADMQNTIAAHLNTMVRNALGITAKEYIQQRVLLEAKRMALHTNLTAKEIGQQLGYDDPNQFGRFFKAALGINFSEFKTHIQQVYR